MIDFMHIVNKGKTISILKNKGVFISKQVF